MTKYIYNLFFTRWLILSVSVFGSSNDYLPNVMKKISLLILTLLFILSFAVSCSRETSFSEKISGKWKMVKVLELNDDVTENHNPGNNRWISFKANPDTSFQGTFESGTGEERENTGKWFYDEKLNEFFLDSDAGEEDDSYWQVSFNADTMCWKGRKFEFNKRFEIFYKKAE